jgi:hypothetical protein
MSPCLAPGCNEWTLTTWPLCYHYDKVRQRLIDGYTETARVDGQLRRLWVRVHKLPAA